MTETLSNTVVNVGPAPAQLPVGSGGITLVNTTEAAIEVSTDQTMQVNPVIIQPGGTTTLDAGTYWVTCGIQTTIAVIPGKQNFNSGSTIISGGTVTILPGSDPIDVTGDVDVTGSVIQIDAGQVVEVINPGVENLNVGPQEQIIAQGVTGASGGTGYVQTFTLPPDINTIILMLGAVVIPAGTVAYVVGNNSDAVQIINFPTVTPPGTLFPVNGGVSYPVPVFSVGNLDTQITVTFPVVPTSTKFWILGSNDYYAETVNVEGSVDVVGQVSSGPNPTISCSQSIPTSHTNNAIGILPPLSGVTYRIYDILIQGLAVTASGNPDIVDIVSWDGTGTRFTAQPSSTHFPNYSSTIVPAGSLMTVLIPDTILASPVPYIIPPSGIQLPTGAGLGLVSTGLVGGGDTDQVCYNVLAGVT